MQVVTTWASQFALWLLVSVSLQTKMTVAESAAIVGESKPTDVYGGLFWLWDRLAPSNTMLPIHLAICRDATKKIVCPVMFHGYDYSRAFFTSVVTQIEATGPWSEPF